jgi:glycosyltransferase involved in cell wall biosynthesis
MEPRSLTKELTPLAARHPLLIISHDVVGEQMAGPGIRYYHLARVLAQHVPTTLAIPNGSSPTFTGEGFQVVRYQSGQWATLAAAVQAAALCLFPSDIANTLPEIATSDRVLIVDGYDPLLAEWLALQSQADATLRQNGWQQRMIELTQQCLIGDFYICASERQRDWWLGLLEANGRINPLTHAADPSLRRLIDVAPYGLPGTLPPPTHPVIKGVWPGIDPAAKLILWGGGLWPWLDPVTAIQAVGKVWQTRRDVKLVFPGTRHPNPQMSGMATQNEQAYQAADTLGLRDRAIFFGDWVAYGDWPTVLQESALALTLHYDTLETRLAFRSRVLEYIGAGLPIIATCGDATSELVTHYQLGTVVDYQDVDGVAAAIQHWLDQPPASYQANFAQAQADLTWERVLEPLIRFCQAPQRAPDRVAQQSSPGNPYYLHRQAELERLQQLVQAYERGRFMRLMKRVKGWLPR